MKYLIIGDPHITKDFVVEGMKFIDWIVMSCLEHRAVPLFLGDLYHNHGLVHVEVANFWAWAFKRIITEVESAAIVIPGNHDCNHTCTHTALGVHLPYIHLAWPSLKIPAGNHKMAGVRFYRNQDDFSAEVMRLYGEGYRTFFCHQEFNGAQFENGFFAPEGVDPLKFPEEVNFICGHIHKRQRLGDKVFYIGASRQIRVDDLGETKKAVLMDTSADFVTYQDFEIPVTVFEPFVEYVITEKNKKDLKNIKNSPRSLVRVQGSEEFCRKILAKAPAQARIIKSITGTETTRKAEVQESVGIPAAFRQFVDSYTKTHPESEPLMPAVLQEIFDKCSLLREGKTHE